MAWLYLQIVCSGTLKSTTCTVTDKRTAQSRNRWDKNHIHVHGSLACWMFDYHFYSADIFQEGILFMFVKVGDYTCTQQAWCYWCTCMYYHMVRYNSIGHVQCTVDIIPGHNCSKIILLINLWNEFVEIWYNLKAMKFFQNSLGCFRTKSIQKLHNALL